MLLAVHDNIEPVVIYDQVPISDEDGYDVKEDDSAHDIEKLPDDYLISLAIKAKTKQRMTPFFFKLWYSEMQHLTNTSEEDFLKAVA
jgi:hypothetical protein